VTRTFNLQIGKPVVTVAAVYVSGNIAVPIPDLGTVDIPVNVVDAGFVSDVNVRVRLNHTRDADLTLTLISPDGTPVTLARNRGGAGDAFALRTSHCASPP